MPKAIELLEAATDELLDALEDMCHQWCGETPDGEVDSGAISANADALELLAKHGRFTIDRGIGRMIVGRWKRELTPINDVDPSRIL